jgi:FtsH-binding integral membrane protein
MVGCILGLAVFVGYVAYDIRKLDYYGDDENMAIMGAFDLYLDFINIFLRLLELFGKSRD